ncbi:GerW family sporulation protein [Desulfitobacterium metallireducens]|uniref:Sporulation protein YtfJ n=1 Tax=Desulfitobacterium metallireducens DSM 15288 TaxID=871968 RepID=W0EDN9_9FIRM|nr:GerW family sporulation protein [Desulfitobacterium metallireducens]AHF07309.1 sporulation protein YtfJ [Desulfitobacterium metallireducens DSM 15288]
MGNHPIEALMKTAMESIQQMVDVNTIVGDPVEAPDGTIIIPVSRVACGFAAGGSEFPPPEGDKNKEEDKQDKQGSSALPFGGGSGAGVSVQPVGFLVVGHGQVRLLPVDNNMIVDRIIDEVPGMVDKVAALLKKKDNQSKKDDYNDDEIIIVKD